MSKTLEELKKGRQDPETKLRELVTESKYITEALKTIEAMDIHTIGAVSYTHLTLPTSDLV